MFSLSMTFYLFPMAFRSWGSVERGPTYFTCLLKIPVHYHSDIYSPILPHEEGYGIQAFSRYLCLVQQITGIDHLKAPLITLKYRIAMLSYMCLNCQADSGPSNFAVQV